MVKRLTPGLAAAFGLVLGLLAACDDTTFNQKLQTFCEGDASTGACSCNEGTALNPRCCINDGYACASAADCCGKACAAAGDGGTVCSGADGGARVDGGTGDGGGADAGAGDAGSDGGPPGADAGGQCLDVAGTMTACLANGSPCTLDFECQTFECFRGQCASASAGFSSLLGERCTDTSDCEASSVCVTDAGASTCQALECLNWGQDGGYCWIRNQERSATLSDDAGVPTFGACIPPGSAAGSQSGNSEVPCCRFDCGGARCNCADVSDTICRCVGNSCAMKVSWFVCPL